MHPQLPFLFGFAFHLSQSPGLFRISAVSACRSSNERLPWQPGPEIDTCLFTTKELWRICEIESVVLWTSYSVGFWPVSLFAKIMFVHNIRMMHFDGLNLINDKNKLDELIWDTYSTNRMRNYVLIMEDPQSVMESVQRVFKSNQRGAGALMPHQMYVLVIAPSHLKNIILDTLTNTSMDNVAVVFASDEYCMFERVYTLMWRHNRRREFEEIKASNFFNINKSDQNCQIFPNKKLAMNGRPLVILAKEWLSHLYKKVDQSSGKLRYAGLYVDIIETLSRSLNFTYNFTPEPGEDDNITWADFTNHVGGSLVDLGATTYISNSMLYYNHTVTYPLLWSNVSGIYINKQNGGVRFPLSLFKLEIYVCLLSALLFTVFLYLLLVRISPGNDSTNCSRNNEPDQKSSGRPNEGPQTRLRRASTRSIGTQTLERILCKSCGEHRSFDQIYNGNHSLSCPPRDTNFKNVTFRKFSLDEGRGIWNNVGNKSENKRKKSKISMSLKALGCLQVRDNSGVYRKCKLVDDLLGIFFTFVGSIFSQESVPCPKDLSARVLLWSWCLMVLVLTATFTGNITADLVDHQETAPFTTFEELLTRGDYKWGLFGESSFYNVMKNAREGTMLKKLYDGMIRFSQTDPTVVGTFEQQITKLKTEKFVTFFFSGDLEYLKERIDDMSNIVIITDHLMTINMGFVCPKTSKLSELISEELLRMTETGVLDNILRRKGNSTRLGRGVADGNKEGSRIDVKYMEGLFYCCGCGVLLSFSVLILENLYMKICDYFT